MNLFLRAIVILLGWDVHVLLYTDARQQGLRTSYMSYLHGSQEPIYQSINVSTFPSGYIASHRGYDLQPPQAYPQSTRTFLNLTGLNTAYDDVVILQFETFYLSPVRCTTHNPISNYCHEYVCDDYLRIANDIYVQCGGFFRYQTKSFLITSDTFQFEFRSDNLVGDNEVGFKFKYTVPPAVPSTNMPPIISEVPIRTTTKYLLTRPLTGIAETETSSAVVATTKQPVTSYNSMKDPNAKTGAENNATTIGAAVGGTAAVCVIVLVIAVIILMKRRQNKRPQIVPPEGEQHYVNGETHSSNDNANISMSALNSNTDDVDYYYQLEDTTAPSNFANRPPTTSDNVYNLANDDIVPDHALAQEEAPVPAVRPTIQAVTPSDRDCDMARQVSAGQVSDQNRGDYDIADDDDYQLAGATGDEYENFTSIQSAEDEREMTEDYAPVRAANKKNKVTELVDNDLYGT